MAKGPGKLQVLGWLGLCLVLPLGTWFTATMRAGLSQKSLSNLTLEPLLVAVSAIVVFIGWFLLSRNGLRPSVGLVLLIILACAALAVQRFVPTLRE